MAILALARTTSSATPCERTLPKTVGTVLLAALVPARVLFVGGRAKVDTMFSSVLLKDSAERAVSTFCQTLVALVGTDGAGLLDVGLVDSLMASLAAAVLSIVKSYAAIRGPIGGVNPSMVDIDDE